MLNPQIKPGSIVVFSSINNDINDNLTQNKNDIDTAIFIRNRDYSVGSSVIIKMADVLVDGRVMTVPVGLLEEY